MPEPKEEFVRIRDFLRRTGMSYSTYRNLREKGKTPKEMRLTQRTILISEAAIKEWLMQNEEHSSQQRSLA
jgi:predicted DNA-binding transcriptional regulator AlpA